MSALSASVLGTVATVGATQTDKLTLIYTSSGQLYTAYYDGTNWSGNTAVSSQPGNITLSTNLAPSVAVMNNRLYVVYKDATTTDICYACYDGKLWTGGVKIKNMPGDIQPKSSNTPNIAVYQGRLYMTYISPSSSDVYTAWFDGTTWFGNKKIKDQSGGITPQSSDSPAIIAYNNELYIVYLGKLLNRLYSASFNGITWSGNTLISDQPGGISPRTPSTPGICVFNDKLYLSYRGIFTSALYTASFDGTTWYGNDSISSQNGNISPYSADNPGMVSFYEVDGPTSGENLYLSYRGSWRQRLFTCWFTPGQEWYGDDPIADQPPENISPYSPYRPAVTVLNNPPGDQGHWMANVSGTTLLSEINIPGSHDAAAINTSIHTPYACHNNTITQQLHNGVRVLDVRLQVAYDTTTSTYTFTTCHGNIGSKIGINTYQSFPSLMDECKTFLTSSNQEVIIMSLKIDDWSNVPENQHAAALSNLQTAVLANYPVTIPAAMPQLQDVRGKIVLFNRISQTNTNLGIYIDWPGNTQGAAATMSTGYTGYVQDQYAGLPLVGATQAKLNDVTALFSRPKTTGEVVLNFASATWYGVFGVYIMPGLLNFLGAQPGAQRPSKLGWILFDYPFNMYTSTTYGPMNIASLIIDSNFGYPTYGNTFQLYSS